jgi:hypothetical protein
MVHPLLDRFSGSSCQGHRRQALELLNVVGHITCDLLHLPAKGIRRPGKGLQLLLTQEGSLQGHLVRCCRLHDEGNGVEQRL